MHPLLCQTAAPSEKQIKAAEQAIVQLLSGVEDAAHQQPNSYLMIIALAIVILGAHVGLWMLLRYLRGLHERDKQRADDTQQLIYRAFDHQQQSAAECHNNSQEMLSKLDKPIEDLRAINTDLSKSVHDLRGMTQAAMVYQIKHDKEEK